MSTAELTPEERALQRIQEAKRSGASKLDLSQLGLTQLPREMLWQIADLTNLQVLDLHSNRLTDPDCLDGVEFKKLHTLYLYDNQLCDVFLWRNTALQTLDLHSNQLTDLPFEIGQLTSLQFLSLHSNQLGGMLHAGIGRLTKLTFLDLHNNQLGSLPKEIGQLTSLKTLNLAKNPDLSTPPLEIGPLANLQTLDLRGTTLELTRAEFLHQFNNLITCYLPEPQRA